MDNIVIGLAAHVDAGKTTLAEELLFAGGAIRKKGRVDEGSAYLDDSDIERSRGITVFSHQAVMRTEHKYITLLDTPGHADFAARAEQCIRVMDMCILLISASDGIQSHTKTLWRLLEQSHVPVLFFVNKTDLVGIDRDRVYAQLRQLTDDRAADFSGDVRESAALADDRLFEAWSEGGLTDDMIRDAIADRRVYPVMWGSALKSRGIEELIHIIDRFAPVKSYTDVFGARAFKLTSDGKNVLVHIKVTGGKLAVKDVVDGHKINEIRIFSGGRAEQTDCVYAGQCAAFVCDGIRPGDGLGAEEDDRSYGMIPVMRYSVSADCDAHTLLERMNGLAADMPTLSPSADSMSPTADGTSPSDSRIHISVMGKMELDVIRDLYQKRYGGDITFGSGTVRYMETIEGSTVGYGHYEPLRHYAEVIVRIEAAPRGSGVSVTSECPEDVLSTARQKTIVSALMTETHYGVLTGSPLTDVHIVLTGGRIHVKHTEGGDLRQAARRAVRQGLMKAKSVLLEPCYEYTMELPSSAVGRAMTDLDMMGAAAEPSVTGDGAVITGRAAAAAINSYQSELASYTGGEGRLLLTFSGYIPVKDTEEIVSSIGYDPSADTADPPDSVFCIKGAAAVIRWDQVENYIHSDVGDEDDGGDDDQITPARIARFKARLYSDDELMEVFERTYGKIDRPKRNAMRRDDVPVKHRRPAPPKTGPDYLLVDGYNIIFAWDELSDLARTSLDHARKRLIDILANYTGFKGCETILVFDAYKVRGGKGETERESGITVVYTKEAETADMYIERASYEIKDARRIRVATSDYAEQLIILGNGALRVPAAELREEIAQVEEAIRAVIAEK